MDKTKKKNGNNFNLWVLIRNLATATDFSMYFTFVKHPGSNIADIIVQHRGNDCTSCTSLCNKRIFLSLEIFLILVILSNMTLVNYHTRVFLYCT